MIKLFETKVIFANITYAFLRVYC